MDGATHASRCSYLASPSTNTCDCGAWGHWSGCLCERCVQDALADDEREARRCSAVGCGVELGGPGDDNELCRECRREVGR